jgi:fusion and transport protein UGO1
MQAPREGPNPLRPYYIPPKIGHEPAVHNATTSAPKSAPAATSFSFPDLDYSDYVPEGSASVAGSVKKLLDGIVWKYTSVLMAQPFEVAKLILQVHVAQDEDIDLVRPKHSARSSYREEYVEELENSSDDEPNYFTSAAPLEEEPRYSPARGRRGRPQREESMGSGRGSTRPEQSPYRLNIKNPHSLLDALSSLSANSGPFSLWRATNSTFIYSILSRTLESFIRSFLAATFGVADPDILIPSASGAIPDSAILAAASPMVAVLIATASSAVTSLFLAPIDAARTRLILTPSSNEPRSLLATLRTLSPSYIIPSHLAPITFLTSTIPAAISTSTPIFLKSYLKLDPLLNPTSWSVGTFVGSALDLTIRFPLETVLRRAQIATWTAPNLGPPSSNSKRKALQTIVPVPQSYRGVVPTLWGIMREEGYSESSKDKLAAAAGRAPRRKRKGQGVEGLYRGWRVGLWGLVGVWGASFVSGLQTGGEAAAELPGIHGGKF